MAIWLQAKPEVHVCDDSNAVPGSFHHAVPRQRDEWFADAAAVINPKYTNDFTSELPSENDEIRSKINTDKLPEIINRNISNSI